MEDQLSCFHSSEAHSAEADTRARPTVIRVNDLIGRQRHPKPIGEDHECSWWTVLQDRQALDEVPFAIQAYSGDEFNEQREFVQKNVPGLPGLRIGGVRWAVYPGFVSRRTQPKCATEILGLLRTISASHVDIPITTLTRDADTPRIAAHFAVLDKTARNAGLLDLAVLAAVRAGHNELVVHTRQPLTRMDEAGYKYRLETWRAF